MTRLKTPALPITLYLGLIMVTVNKQDEALAVSNPRLLSAVYFGLLAIVITILIDTIMYVLGIEQIIPPFKAIILSVVVAAAFAAIFGEHIVHSKAPYRKHVFFWAFFMVILSIPVYALGFLYFTQQHHSAMFEHATFTQWIYIYLLTVLYSFILAGIWIAVLAGLAAIFLRSHLVYYLVDSLYKKRQTPPSHPVDEHTTSYSLDTPPGEKKHK